MLPDNIEAKIERIPESGCWIWNGSTDKFDYGFVQMAGKGRRAHRVVYELLVGPIPAGLVIDHLCRVHSCVNPYHLEPVTDRVNTMRGIGVTAENAKKTHCQYGHEYAGDNLRLAKWKGEVYRVCRACHRERELARYFRKSQSKEGESK